MSEHLLMGLLMAKIDYWRHRYNFSFQIWSKDELNVYIYREDVEVYSMGGKDSIQELMADTIKWCEGAYPRYKYPAGIEMTNPYAGT